MRSVVGWKGEKLLRYKGFSGFEMGDKSETIFGFVFGTMVET